MRGDAADGFLLAVMARIMRLNAAQLYGMGIDGLPASYAGNEV